MTLDKFSKVFPTIIKESFYFKFYFRNTFQIIHQELPHKQVGVLEKMRKMYLIR